MPINNISRSIRSLSSITFLLLRCSPPPPTKFYPKPFLPVNRSPAMASTGETVNFSTVLPEEDDVEFGFKRSEMYQSNLAGTVDPYERHVFLCYKSCESWPSRVEDSDSDLLPKLLAAALKARKADIKVKVSPPKNSIEIIQFWSTYRFSYVL